MSASKHTNPARSRARLYPLRAAMRSVLLASAAGAAMAAQAASPAAAPAANDAGAGAEARARELLETMGFENLLRHMIVQANDQGRDGAREPGDPALLRRWLAATRLHAVSAQTAQALAARTEAGQIEQALGYFRSPAGQTELGCLRDAQGAPVVGGCIEERGGPVQLQAHRDFAETAVEQTLGDVLGDAFAAPLFAAIAAARDDDPALKREVETYCERRPTGLCAMIAADGEGAAAAPTDPARSEP